MSDELVEIDIEILGQTDLAVQVYDGPQIAWIPKSQISDPYDMSYYEEGQSVTITIPERLAFKKGLI